MTRAYRFLSLALLLVLSASSARLASAQSPPTTGTPPFGSFGGGPEVINLANNNVHWDVPVLAKPGRGGFNFTYDLSYDSSVWAGGVSSGTSLWYPVGNWGWRGITEASMGYLWYTSSMHLSCQIWNPDDRRWDKYFYYLYNFNVYGDPFGIPHPLNVTLEDDETGGNCPNNPPPNIPSYATGAISDGSGYGYSLQVPPSQSLEAIYPPSGGVIHPPLSRFAVAANSTDRNGNQITVNSSGQFFDTLSSTTPVLTVSGSSPMTFTYTAPSGANASYSMKYTAYTVKTNFGCPNISEYGPTSNNLVSEIDLPDGSKYTFGYEVTPGYPGDTTGRLASVTLPTGGTISYTYSGGNNGIVCADGSTATLTRTTPDTGSNSWTYVHSESGTAWTTLVTDPQGNQTNLNFQGIYETQRQVYSGLQSGGNLLRQWGTCYNGNTSNCNGAAVTLPITQRTVTDQYGTSGLQCKHNYLYNPGGGLTEQDDYDYGSGSPGGLLRQVLITYASLGNITAFRQQVTVKDGSGNIKSQTNYNYDESTPGSTSSWGITQHTSVSGSRGNLTSINYPVSGLTAHFTYYDTGVPNTSQDVNTATTTYNYGTSTTANCNGAFPVSIGEPLSMSRSMTWNCTGGVQLTSVDENNQTTTTDYTDAAFWRPADVKFPDGGQTNWTYNSQTSVTTTTKMNSSQNIVSTVLLDGLGRTKETQLNSDPEGVDYTDTSYDALGRLASVSNPYRSTSDPTYGTTSYQYDALSRVTNVTLQDGSASTASYTNNAVTATDPAGKKRQVTMDSLGRLIQITEDPGGLGYVTTYGYDALSNLISVTQNGSRQRAYVYDAMSRLTSETNPETGTTNYKYDSDSNCASPNSSSGDLISRTDARSIRTCFQYDTLHRPTQKNYSDGTPNATYAYDMANPWGSPYGGSYKGRLSEADTHDSSGNFVASHIFVYDSMGRIQETGQCTVVNCSTGLPGFHTTYSHDLSGNLTSYGTAENGITFSYQYDTAGRPTAVTSSLVDSQHPATLATVDSSVGYYPMGALGKMTFGNGLSQIAQVERRMQPCQINLSASGSLLGGCGVTPPSGTVQDFHFAYGNWGSTNNNEVTEEVASGAQNFDRRFSYDSLNRLSTMTAASSDPSGCTGLSWTYDAWGNRTDQNNTGGSCGQFHATVNAATNQLTDPINNAFQYDAAGNMINDGNHSYTYDAENRLTKVDGGTTASYSYDALGNRVQKNVGSAVTVYVFNPANQVIHETDANLNFNSNYIYMGGQLVAEYKNNTTYFAHGDHLGSTRLLTGLTGAVVQNVDYLPFGEEIPDSPSIPVVNPGFESGGSGWNLGFWGCTSNITTTQAHSGSYSLAQTGSVTGGSYQDLGGVVSGNSYQVSMWVKADAGTTAQAMLWVHDTAGGNAIQSTQFTPGTAWQQVTVTFTADSTNMMRIHLYFSAGSGTIYYDDVQVQSLNSVGDTNITTHKFTGDERDSETNLDHTWFRQYSSQLGRWMHPDPAGLAAVDITNPQSWNRYAHVLGNPMSLVDPLGLTPQCWTVENREPNDPNQQQDPKSGGPFAPDASSDVPAPDPQAPGSTGGCKAGGGGGGGFDDGSWTLDGGFAGDDSGTGVGIPIGGGDLASQIALMQIPVSGTYYGWHSQVGPSGTIGGLAYDSNIWWYGWGSSTIGSAFFVVTPGPGSDSSSYWAFAAPWYFNPKGLKGPYPPNSGPTLQKPPINPKEPPPDLKWPNEEEVTLMEQTAHVLKMIAEARVAISVPLFINLCQSSTPVFDPVKHKWSCPGDAIY